LALFLFCAYVAAEEAATPGERPDPSAPVTVAVARDRAQLMQRIYANTLEVMHDRYFHDERAIVPARAMEDVFTQLKKETNIGARWISVNTKPMSLHHEPKSDFEKQAAKEISAGKEAFELVEKGYYQRAIAIPLGSNCVSCHTGFFMGAPKSPRFAALVVRIPVTQE